MKRLFFIISAIFFAISLQAQTGGNWVEDKQAKEIMSKLAKKLANVTAISADITMTTENKTEKTKNEQKITALVSNTKYRLLFNSQAVYCDGKSVWHYNKAANEVTLTVADSTEMQQINLPKIISEWGKNYRAKLIREEEQSGGIVQILDLTPKKRQDYHKIRLILNKNKQEIQQMQFHYFEGEIVSYVFSSYKTNPKITASDFVFDASAYPSAEIIDLR